MTRGIAETRRRLVEWPLKYDAHTWPRSADRRPLRPTGRGEYGYNRVQEIVSGTETVCQPISAKSWMAGCSTRKSSEKTLAIIDYDKVRKSDRISVSSNFS